MRDQVVVVTGAGSGIGRATARAFAARGARIAACDVDQARLDALAVDLGDRALVVRKVDVADRAQMAAFAAEVHAEVAAVDVLVNNAGVAVGGNFLDTSLDDWDWLLGINLRGVVHGCHFFIPRMVDRKRGSVINISSIFGLFPAPQTSAYVASKFGVLGMSKVLRAELAPHHIGVTAICPGMINTAIVSDGRLAGAALIERKPRVVATFKKRGTPPEAVAAEILEAVRTNPAVRIVGRDANIIHALARVAPEMTQRYGARFARWFGAS